MIVDLHTHIVPEQFPDAAGRGAGRWPSMAHNQPGRADVMISGKNFRTVRDVCWHPQIRASEARKEGADVQAISPMPELLAYWFSPRDGLEMSRYVNEVIATMCQAEPDVFHGLGMVPLQDPDLAAKELAPMRQAGLKGVELGSNILGHSLGEDQYKDFFNEAEAQGMAVFVHALHPTFTDRFLANERTVNAIGFATEGGLNIGSMVVSGLWERCPSLRVCFSHGGGTFPYYLPRLQNSWSGRWNDEDPLPAEGMLTTMRNLLPKSPAHYARMAYYDTLVFDRRTTRYLIDMMGVSQVTIGTDFPFVARESPVGKSTRAVVSDEEWELISEKNALRFLGLAS